MRPFLASLLASVVLAILAADVPAGQPGDVAGGRTAPQPLEFDKRILDGSAIGVLFPCFGDFDGDGKIDLLVGVQGLGQGRLREAWSEGGLLVYLNQGTNAAPVYAKPFWFDHVVPSGRIPSA